MYLWAMFIFELNFLCRRSRFCSTLLCKLTTVTLVKVERQLFVMLHCLNFFVTSFDNSYLVYFSLIRRITTFSKRNQLQLLTLNQIAAWHLQLTTSFWNTSGELHLRLKECWVFRLGIKLPLKLSWEILPSRMCTPTRHIGT